MKALIMMSLASVLVLGGCAGKGGKKDGQHAGEESPITLGSEGGATTTPLGQGRGPGGRAGAGAYGPGALSDPSSPLSKRIIYFEYDNDQVPPAYADIINAHAAYLASNPGQRARLAGHTDERGSREYNLSLGERRGLAVQRALMLQGAQRSQVDTVSYGEEVPANLGHDEQSWQLNRRVVIEYLGN